MTVPASMPDTACKTAAALGPSDQNNSCYRTCGPTPTELAAINGADAQ